MNKQMIRIMIVEVLLLAGWCACVVVFTDFSNKGFNFWCALSFSIAAFAVTFLSIVLANVSGNRNLTEAANIPNIISIIYLIIAVLFNAIFLFYIREQLDKLLLIVNIFILIIFAVARIYINSYIDRLNEQTNKIIKKSEPASDLSVKISLLISKVEDIEIRNKLLNLKEAMDFSPNLSQTQTIGCENMMEKQLEKIDGLINSNASKDEIKDRIKEADIIWKSRNSISAVIK